MILSLSFQICFKVYATGSQGPGSKPSTRAAKGIGSIPASRATSGAGKRKEEEKKSHEVRKKEEEDPNLGKGGKAKIVTTTEKVTVPVEKKEETVDTSKEDKKEVVTVKATKGSCCSIF